MLRATLGEHDPVELLHRTSSLIKPLKKRCWHISPSDAFIKRENAQEAMYMQQKEKEK